VPSGPLVHGPRHDRCIDGIRTQRPIHCITRPIMRRYIFGSLVALAGGAIVMACARKAPPQPSPQESGQAPVAAAAQATPQVGAPRRGCTENFGSFDDDGDGRVSLAEFTSRPHVRTDFAEVFRGRDGDGDGSLTASEFCAGWPEDRGRGAGAGQGPGPRAGRGNPMGGRRLRAPMAATACEEHFLAFDSDGDGNVTKEEFLGWPHARGDAEAVFVERDSDGDGALTSAEFCAPW
jgi:Ca2+-binding EF-hand superfamily protein